MADARDAWKDVADKVESLGLKLKLHLEQEQDDLVADRAEGDMSNAFEQIAGQVTEALNSFGNAAKDTAVHDDVRAIADLMKQALSATFQAVGSEVGDLMEQIEDYAEDTAERIAGAVGHGDDADDGDDDEGRSPVQDTLSP